MEHVSEINQNPIVRRTDEEISGNWGLGMVYRTGWTEGETSVSTTGITSTTCDGIYIGIFLGFDVVSSSV